MSLNRTCDGVARRDFLKAGVLGMGGLSLSGYLGLAKAGAVGSDAPAKAVIFVYLNGGMSHLDTLDPKPDAPDNIRGEFKPIDTAGDFQLGEVLPSLAKVADRFSLVRGMSHNLAAHQFGTKYMITGNRPLPSLEFPSFGSVVSKETTGPSDLPGFVAVPNTPMDPGFLGVSYAPFTTGTAPQKGRPYNVRGISLPGGITLDQLEKREKLLGDLDTRFAGFESRIDVLGGLDRFGDEAYRILSSKRARDAFDLAQEKPAVADTFGDTNFGQSCLLAARLVESGVRFVTLSLGGWDTHQDNFARLRDKQCPQLDQGVAGLIAGLEQRGLLESTLVVVTGEFGRTPKINERGGRDHWPRGMAVLLAGGGIAGGRAVGASDDKGMGPAGDGYSPDDLAVTIYRQLGIDPTKEYHTHTGRPVMIVRNGSPIKDLLA